MADEFSVNTSWWAKTGDATATPSRKSAVLLIIRGWLLFYLGSNANCKRENPPMPSYGASHDRGVLEKMGVTKGKVWPPS
jgi:hypothetical protein